MHTRCRAVHLPLAVLSTKARRDPGRTVGSRLMTEQARVPNISALPAADSAAGATAAVADERTLEILDFSDVLQLLAERAASPLGRVCALALRPSARRRQIETDQRETAQARLLLEQADSIPLQGLHDIAEHVGRAARGAILAPKELWQVGDTAGCLGRLRAYFGQRLGLAPDLADWAEGIANFGEVHSEVTRCLLPDGEVLDRASLALAEARREVRRLEAAVRDKLDELVRSAAVQGALQEPLITQRQDRFVLPVKADSRGAVPGLVHDQSATGATVFVEPMAVVELGNRLRAAQAAVGNEIARILGELSELCGRDLYAWERSLEVGAHLDLCVAKGRLACDWAAVAPRLLDHPGLELRRARHPLIVRPVPVDIRVGLDFDALVLTGPNTGGKTVSLKIAGLFACMAQAGLQLPASDAQLGVFPRVCGDAGDDQGVAQSLSTFSSHMRAVVAAVRAVVPGALVLLDELGAGTDPGEGASLAMALLEHLLAAGARVIVTTHYSELKAFAYRTPRVENGSVSFDPETLEPTYRLVIGVPGPSQAFAIASRLGLAQAVVERARAMQRPEERQVERMIEGLAADEQRMREAAAKAAAESATVTQLREALEAERTALQEVRVRMVSEAKQEAASLLAEARRLADGSLREIRRLAEQAERDGARRALETAEAHRAELRRAGAHLAERVPAPNAGQGHWHAGQPVRILSLEREGVLTAPPENGNAVVQAGTLRLNVPVEDLAPTRAAPDALAKGTARHTAALVPFLRGAPLECDLRGMDRLDALAKVDKALDDAILTGMDELRLIHGKGTGALREAVSEFLRGHPQVKSFRLGGVGEGGDGATVVALRG